MALVICWDSAHAVGSDLKITMSFSQICEEMSSSGCNLEH